MEFGVIEWYCNENSLDILGFYPYKSGFYIIGGLTGSHHSGHGEMAYEKERELRAKGYIPVKDAIGKGILNQNWQEPRRIEGQGYTFHKMRFQLAPRRAEEAGQSGF